MNQPANMMEVGPNGNNLAAAARQKHPIDLLQQQQGTCKYDILCKQGSRDESI